MDSVAIEEEQMEYNEEKVDEIALALLHMTTKLFRQHFGLQ